MYRFHQSLVLLGLALPQAAHATVAHTFCFGYDVSYTDGSTGEEFTGTDYVANGATFRIIRNSNNDTYDFALATTGCRTIILAAEPWTVKLLRTATVNGTTVEVRSDSGGGLFSTTVSSSFTPSHGNTTTWDVGVSGNINIMAAATWVLATLGDASFGGTYSFRNGTTNCTAGQDACWDVNTNTININSALDDYKFVIGHELAHAIGDKLNGSQGLDWDDSAALNACDGANSGLTHAMESKEFQSMAAVEGIANFWAAAAFNGDYLDACDYETHYVPDWDQDNDPLNNSATFSCSGSPETGIGSFDYLGEMCLATGAVNNRATEYDWLRHWWDFYQAEQFGLWYRAHENMEIFDLANPNSWEINGAGTLGNYPAQRFHEAAVTVNLEAEWDDCAADNGVNR